MHQIHQVAINGTHLQLAAAKTAHDAQGIDQPSVEAILEDVLADRAILLVLDNFEQVLGAVRFISDLLAACPRLGLLVTSREPLHIRAEQVLHVRPLPLHDPQVSDPRTVAANPAVAMFVDRGKAARPSFQLTEENVPAVVEICTRLDGLPLAIELTAAQLGVFSAQAIGERLRSRAPFVLSGVADLPARHRTLRAAVSSSYELLDPQQRAVFRWCAVFAGGFTSAAAGDVMVDVIRSRTYCRFLPRLQTRTCFRCPKSRMGNHAFGGSKRSARTRSTC